MSQGDSSLSVRMLDKIYDQVLENLKTSGRFDEMRVSLLEPAFKNPEIKAIMDAYMQTYTKSLKLDQDRKILRTNLDKDIVESFSVKLGLKQLIDSILVEKGPELKSKFTIQAEEFLKKEFLSRTPEHNISDGSIKKEDPTPQPQLPDDSSQIDMDLESNCGDVAASPKAPDFSPISIDANDLDHHEAGNHTPNHATVKIEPNMTNDQEPSLESIPIPPEDIPIPSEDESQTPVMDEPHQDENTTNEDDDNMTFSSISSVRTNDLNDFEDSINLSDDEAKIVGQPIKSRMKIEELQKNINGLNTKDIVHEQEPREQSASLRCETSESDACSESAATGRRAARQRKLNPRYSNEHFTS